MNHLRLRALGLGALLISAGALLFFQYRNLSRLTEARIASRHAQLDELVWALPRRAQADLRERFAWLLDHELDESFRRSSAELESWLCRQDDTGVTLAFAVVFHGSQQEFLLVRERQPVRLEEIPATLDEALDEAVFPSWLVHQAEERPGAVGLMVHSRSPESPILLRSLLDHRGQVAAVAGVVLDRSWLASEVLARVEERLRRELLSAQELPLVTTRLLEVDGASPPAEPAARRTSLPPPFDAWTYQVSAPPAAIEKLERRAFVLQMSLTAGLALLLLAGTVLLLRGARQQMRLVGLQREFVENVSHELRTPLSSLRAFGELLHRGRVRTASQTEEFGRRIEQESLRLMRLVEQVLALGTNDPAREGRADLMEQVHAAVRRHRQTHPDAIEVQQGEGLDRLTVGIEASALRQVLDNLLENAFQHGRPPVVVSISEDSTGGELRVRDHGPGVPAPDRRRIFERFGRGSAVTPGIGLGLALARELVERHGGTLELVDCPGPGACFQVRLPRAEEPACLTS